MDTNIALGLSNIGTAVLFIVMAIPLIQGTVKMNHFYGVRIKKSFESEKNWYAINEYGGKQLVLWSIPIILAGVGCFFIPITAQNKYVMSLIMGVGPIGVCLALAVTRIYAFAKKL